MAKRDTAESPSDWTELLSTRVSPRAKKLVGDRLNARGGMSQSAWVRELVYRELGIIPPSKAKE